jgi:hypothetical protein
MCRGGLISGLMLAAFVGLGACVDADDAQPVTGVVPVMTGPVAGAAGAGGPPRGGAGGATTPPTTGTGGMAAMPPRPPMGGAGMMPMAMAGMGAGGSAAGGAGGGPAGGAGGAPAAGGGAGGGGAAAAGPTFSDVYSMVLMPRCMGCHGMAGGLSLATKDGAFTALMADSSTCMGMKRVTPGMPAMSALIAAMRGTGCRMGRPMPPMGALPDADIKRVEDWITAGAMNN